MAALFWGLLCLVVCATKVRTAPRLVGLVGLLYGLDVVMVLLPPWLGPWANFNLHYNWTGKLLSALLSLLVIYGLRLASPQEVGLVRTVRGWRVVALVALFFAGLQLGAGYLNRHHHAQPNLETYLYQLTMPGIAEELFSRGILLALLNRLFPRTIPFFGTQTSWGGLATVVLFALGHGFSFAGPLALLPQAPFAFGSAGNAAVFGLLFLWVRERSGSCWAAMATHNLSNIGLFVGLSFG